MGPYKTETGISSILTLSNFRLFFMDMQAAWDNLKYYL